MLIPLVLPKHLVHTKLTRLSTFQGVTSICFDPKWISFQLNINKLHWNVSVLLHEKVCINDSSTLVRYASQTEATRLRNSPSVYGYKAGHDLSENTKVSRDTTKWSVTDLHSYYMESRYSLKILFCSRPPCPVSGPPCSGTAPACPQSPPLFHPSHAPSTLLLFPLCLKRFSLLPRSHVCSVSGHRGTSLTEAWHSLQAWSL